MKKTAILSCYFKHNYGSVLQAFATQQFLDSIGIENETINVSENIDFIKGKKKYYFCQLANLSFIKSKFGMLKLYIDRKINKKLNNNIKIREKKYNEFKKNIRLTKPYKTYNELSNQCKNYNNVIVGSDQLWLPVNVVADYYTLNWVPNEVNKISLATSFGVSEISDKYKKLYKIFLNRLDSISVREDSGVKLVKELSGKNAYLSCDPTILLTKSEWEKIKNNENMIKEKYIFCYFLGKNINHRKFAERLKKKTGYKIVSINHADEYVSYSDVFADETPYNVGPAEWLDLISNAEYVCTDSLHGIIFSLIFNKKFYAFERYNNSQDNKISTNSRVYSILGMFDLKNRLLTGCENIDDIIDMNIDFNKVNEKIVSFRKNTISYLKKSLK